MNPSRDGLFFTALLLWAVHLSAAPFTEKALGTRGPAVLRQEPGVRAAALGGAYVAVADDAAGAHWNPAALQQTAGQTVLLSRSDSFGQSDTFLGHTKPVWWAGDRRTVGVSLVRVRFDSVNVVENWDPQGTVSPHDTVVGFTYAQPLFSFSAGGTAKWISHVAGEGSAQSCALDLGLFGKFTSDRGRWGVAVQNAGPGMNQAGTTMKFPFVIRSGISWRLPTLEPNRQCGLLVSTELDAPMDDTLRPRVGLEYETRLNESSRVALRGGWRATAGRVEDGELAVGLGLSMGAVRFNYAYVPAAHVGAVQQAEVGFGFGGVPSQQTERDRIMAEAQLDFTEGWLTKADDKLNEALRLSPRYPPARRMRGEVRRRFNQSVHPETLFILGQRAFARGEYAQAVDYLSKLTIADPAHRGGMDLLVQAEKEVARARREQVHREMAARKHRERAARQRQTETLSRQARWAEALAAGRLWAALDPSDEQAQTQVRRAQNALYEKARSFETTGQLEKALDTFRLLEKDEPGFGDCARRAARLIERIGAVNAESAQAKYEAGLRLLKENDTEEARLLFEDAVRLAPDNKTYQKALERTR